MASLCSTPTWHDSARLCACALFVLAAAGGAPARAEGLHASIGVGAGLGTRRVVVPNSTAEHRLATAPFPAVDLALRVGRSFGAVLLEAGVRYQTAVGLRIAPASLNSPDSGPRVPLRSHSISLGVAPGYQFVRSAPVRLSAHLFVGWAVRGLRSVTELVIPSYTLHGPAFRPELRVAFADGWVELRVAPELLVLFATEPLRVATRSSDLGLGLGGEVAADFRVYEPFHAVLSYRGSYARRPTGWSRSATDVEHFVTLRAELRY